MAQELFEDEKKYPEGFHYWADFISPTQEQVLLDYCNTLPFKPYMYHGYAAKREDVLFGVSYNKSTKTFSLGAPIPAFFDPLINQVGEKANVNPEEIVEMSIQRYPEGAAIGWHRDTPYHRVFGVSLLSDCMFRLKPYSRSDDQRKHIFKIPTQRRSLYELSGKSNSEWLHSIPPVPHKRYSITMRTLNDHYKKILAEQVFNKEK